jgi:hypothetical protein
LVFAQTEETDSPFSLRFHESAEEALFEFGIVFNYENNRLDRKLTVAAT